MAGNLGVLTTTFTANTAPFSAGVTKVGAQTQALGQKVKATSAAMGGFALRMVGMMAATIGAFIAIGQITKGFKEMDDAAKQASRLGMIPSELIELQYVADIAGFGAERLGAAFEKMSKNISEAAHGMGTAKRGFDQLGFSAAALGAMSPADAFKKISAAIREIPNVAERARVAYEIFGRQGIEMLNMIMMTEDQFASLRAELRELAPGLDSLKFENAEEMADHLTRIKYRFKVLRMHVAMQLAPTLQKMVGWVMAVVDWFEKWGTQIKAVFMVIGSFIALLWSYKKIIFLVIGAIMLWKAALVAWSIAKAVQLAFSGPWGWAKLAGAAVVAGIAIVGITSATNAANEKLKAAKRNTDKLADSAKKAGNNYQDMSKEIATAERLAELTKKGEQITRSLRTPVEIFTDTLGELEEMINAGAISWETYNRAIAKANDDLLKTLDTQKKINRARQKGFGAVTRGTVAAFSASQKSDREFTRLRQLQEDDNRMAAERNRILNDIRANIVTAPPVAGI